MASEKKGYHLLLVRVTDAPGIKKELLTEGDSVKQQRKFVLGQYNTGKEVCQQ